MKQRYARLDMSKLPKSYTDEFVIMDKETRGFSDDDLNAVFSENFNDMYALVEKKYPAAIQKGGTIKKEKPSKVRVIKAKKTRPGMPSASDFDGIMPEHPTHRGEIKDEGFRIKAKSASPKRLPTIQYFGNMYFIDFRLEEIREVDGMATYKFKELPIVTKAKLRGIRAEVGENIYMKSLDEVTEIEKVPANLRKKLSEKEIENIEKAIADNPKVSDAALITLLLNISDLSETQAKKWVAKRDIISTVIGTGYTYSSRTAIKKAARKGKDEKTTLDGFIFNQKDPAMKGKKFFDAKGNVWICEGYNEKAKECMAKKEGSKEATDFCIEDMYVNNPVTKREKGNLVDDCKETLKEAGFTVREHKAGTKKIKRSEPRPEKVIIKERVEETFTPIMKDLKGSEDKEKENKQIIVVLESIQFKFTTIMNRISNMADDNKLEQLKKILKLLDEIID